jgi:acyl-coenzyme A synthetase/AMP-(fatty) acid ligase
MPRNDLKSLRKTISSTGNASGRFISGANATFALSDLMQGTCLSGGAEQLRGRSVLIATRDPVASALALIELDGIARRLVLYPVDLPIEHVPFVIASVPVDAIVSDETTLGANHPAIGPYVTCSPKIVPQSCDPSEPHPTEWILLTSGTTGPPKMVTHTLSSLAGAIDDSGVPGHVVWGTFYDIRRYGGLQIFLRAMLTGGSLVLPGFGEPTTDFMIRAASLGVTHISGTPSHWRRALMSQSAQNIDPRYVRLSGEVVDQPILDCLRSFYPQAKIVHAFASTEAGVAFDVRDGFAGFPASLVEQVSDGVEMKVEDGSLRIRSPRTSAGYIGQGGSVLTDEDGFIDTGDMLERRGDRYYFVGRRDGVINVGGLKVHPEEVESVINRHPDVRMSLVRARRSPLTGALVVADVVPRTGPERAGELEREIFQLCREGLAQHKMPVAIRFVSNLEVAATGKLVRKPCGMSS